MSGSCRFDGCTVDETGLCALERDPSSCGNRAANDVPNALSSDVRGNGEFSSNAGERLGAAVLEQPERASAFASSRTLGLDDLNNIMGTRYVNVVGILGDPESGKTACLASLYLLVSHAKLEGWSFRDSKSLTAFEEIARGARDWNDGRAPEQMTVHTELTDDRSPGFLHLRLVRRSDGRCVDLALPDIPGEWTQALVATASSDRFEFMRSAEAIWIVLDGRSLADIEKRHGLIVRMGQLAARLKTMFEGHTPRLMVVVTHRDLYALEDNVAERLRSEFNRRDVEVEIVGVAPFSEQPQNIPAGFGLAKLVNLTIGIPSARPPLWGSTEPAADGRSYLNFRRDR